MQFSLVSDPPGTSLHERALKARNELVSKLLANWQRLAEIQLLYHEPGSIFQRLPQSIDCSVEDKDHYIPSIEDEGIDGDEKLLAQYMDEVQQQRAIVAKQLADTVTRACREAYEELPQTRTFEARVMLFARGGSIEPGPTQKFIASSLGQLRANEATEDDELERPGGPIDKLVSTIDRLVANASTGNDQIRLEKADVHQRYVELTDKNMSMLDKYKELVEMALSQGKLPPEHYTLEATKIHMRTESQRAAMAANTRAAMAHERQKTVQVFIKENPNFIQDLLATAATLYQQQTGGTASNAGPQAPPEDVADPTTTTSGTDDAPGASDASGTSDTPDADGAPESEGMPSLCRGSRKFHEVLDTSTIAALERNLAPDHWRSLSPLLSCTDEAEFRRNINLLTTAFSRLPEGDQALFRAGLRESVPFAAQLQLTQLLGSYGLRIH